VRGDDARELVLDPCRLVVRLVELEPSELATAREVRDSGGRHAAGAPVRARGVLAAERLELRVAGRMRETALLGLDVQDEPFRLDRPLRPARLLGRDRLKQPGDRATAELVQVLGVHELAREPENSREIRLTKTRHGPRRLRRFAYLHNGRAVL
jgi:hypothetical protein